MGRRHFKGGKGRQQGAEQRGKVVGKEQWAQGKMRAPAVPKRAILIAIASVSAVAGMRPHRVT